MFAITERYAVPLTFSNFETPLEVEMKSIPNYRYGLNLKNRYMISH